MGKADKGCLTLILEALLIPPASFLIGWVLGWLVEVLFLGEPYMTAAGFDLKIMVGLVLGGWKLLVYALAAGTVLYMALLDLI